MGGALNHLRGLVASRRWLFGIVAMGFLVRLAWLLLARPEPVNDFADFRNLAAHLLDTGTLGDPEPTAFYPPVNPSFLALLMVVSRTKFWLSLGMVVVSTFNTWLVYQLARELAGRDRVALVAAGAYAISPTFVLYSPVLATEHLFVTLMLTALILTTRQRGTRWLPYMAAGTVLGLAALTRAEAIVYVPVLVGVVLLTDRARPVQTRMRLAAVLIAGVFLVVTPWLVRNLVQVDGAGLALTTTGGGNFYLAHNPFASDVSTYGYRSDTPIAGLTDEEENRLGWKLGFEHLRDDPWSVVSSFRNGVEHLYRSPEYAIDWSTRIPEASGAGHAPKNVPFSGIARWWNRALAGLYLGLAAASLLMWRLWPARLRVVLPGLVLFNLIAYAVVLWGKPRYRHFVDVSLTILVALTLVALWDFSRGAGAAVDGKGAPEG